MTRNAKKSKRGVKLSTCRAHRIAFGLGKGVRTVGAGSARKTRRTPRVE